MPTDAEVLSPLLADPEPVETETDEGPQKSPELRGDDEDPPAAKEG